MLQTLAIDPENHTGKNHIEKAKAETCGVEGYTGDTVCKCGTTVETGKTFPATGKHSWKDATCTAAKTCSVCKITEGKKLEHTYKDKYDTTCEVCGYKRQVEEAKTIPVYRLYNPYVQTNFHMFTADVAERDMQVSVGWMLEGIAWYSVK